MGANNDPVYRSLRIFFITLALLLCGFCSWVYGWFEFLHYKEHQAFSRWDVMNAAIIAEFDPPEGVREIERVTSGGLNRHGRWLYVFYESNTRTLGIADIHTYYEQLLHRGGWKLSHQVKDSYWYFRDTSCIEFYYPEKSKYIIFIWQDYSAYPYSPQLPPEWLLNVFDVWEGEIATCPPK